MPDLVALAMSLSPTLYRQSRAKRRIFLIRHLCLVKNKYFNYKDIQTLFQNSSFNKALPLIFVWQILIISFSRLKLFFRAIKWTGLSYCILLL